MSGGRVRIVRAPRGGVGRGGRATKSVWTLSLFFDGKRAPTAKVASGFGGVGVVVVVVVVVVVGVVVIAGQGQWMGR
jgi:hypothetical protein